MTTVLILLGIAAVAVVVLLVIDTYDWCEHETSDWDVDE